MNKWGKNQVDKPFKVGKMVMRVMLIGICFVCFFAILPRKKGKKVKIYKNLSFKSEVIEKVTKEKMQYQNE